MRKESSILLQKIVNMEFSKHNKKELESIRTKMITLTKNLGMKHNYDRCECMIASLLQQKQSTATIRQLYLK